MPFNLTGSFTEVLNFLAAAGGLGTTAMGVVDATKAFGGGPSNFGFGHIEAALKPFLAPISQDGTPTAKADVLQTLKANWINGVPAADQKAKAKSLIRLGLTEGNAQALAAAAGVDAAKLDSLVKKTSSGLQVSQDELNVLGQFDAVLSAVLDTAYERGDQKYRNACKLLAMGVSTVLGVVGGWVVSSDPTFGYFGTSNFVLSLLVGVSATPLAPVSKDLASALQAAVNSMGLLKG
jgi:hypothetical protein